jgi:hypothetical protein
MDDNTNDNAQQPKSDRRRRTDLLRDLFGSSDTEKKTEATEGISLLEVGMLPDPERTIMNALIRAADPNGVTLSALQGELASIDTVQATLAMLLDKHFVTATELNGQTYYKAKLKKIHGHKPATWSKLLEDE